MFWELVESRYIYALAGAPPNFLSEPSSLQGPACAQVTVPEPGMPSHAPTSRGTGRTGLHIVDEETRIGTRCPFVLYLTPLGLWVGSTPRWAHAGDPKKQPRPGHLQMNRQGRRRQY